ncbi:hypothetical protein X474_26780 [Dethiosulfatarculus sandiegensis]|uniref:Tetratricopeptide repeat protein n=1 Tax=Dethiosulfatarculus sandiegensis TaxID=1429043 RepID=A0A0D2JNB7_9BACT|nr:hypothetical protein X474_26780 [Dethiosulfatarculus sandiegensis]
MRMALWRLWPAVLGRPRRPGKSPHSDSFGVWVNCAVRPNLFSIIGCFLPLIFLIAPSWAAQTIVPEKAYISDFKARRQLGLFYTYSKKYEKALLLLEELYRKNPQKSFLLADMAELELARGHAKKCRELYIKACELHPYDPKLLLDQARAMNLWGDFYRMERIYRQALLINPKDFETSFNLARLLMSAQRFVESEWLYLALLSEDVSVDAVYSSLSKVAWQAGDLDKCLDYAAKALALKADDPVALENSAKVLLKKGYYQKARDYYARLARLPAHQVPGLLGQGEAFLKQGESKKAQNLFAKARQKEPDNPEVQYYFFGTGKALQKDKLNRLLKRGGLTAGDLSAWGGFLARKGHFKEASLFYRASLKVDPDFFPARMGLAETLGSAHEYDKANQLLAQMALDFPGVAKVLITRARVLAWSENYRESLDLYREIGKLNPNDPMPFLEGARTAVWAKDMNLALTLYDRLLIPPLDQVLAERLKLVERNKGLKPDAWPDKASGLLDAVLSARQAKASPRPYSNYQNLSSAFSKESEELARVERSALQRILQDLYPVYLIQKQAAWEKKAKLALWNRHFARALREYQELVRFQPGNREARFDLAQSQCALGLCGSEAQTYEKLLELDALHNLAALALSRQRRRKNPRLGGNYSFWQEKGYGERAQVARSRVDLGFEVPVFCRFKFEAKSHQWSERPIHWAGESKADGFSVNASGPLNPWLRGGLGWTHKNYKPKDLSDLDNGHISLKTNLCDYLELAFGWQREDLVQNAFSIRQGVYADTTWLGIKTQISRRLTALLDLNYLDYNDDNQGQIENLSVAYSFTEHPREFNLMFKLEHRDHEYETREVFGGDQLLDMIHPYWAPQNWWGVALTAEWRHDLSQYFFCGAEKHYYEIRVSLSDDNDDNPGGAIEALWHIDFCDHWDLEAKGSLHSSDKWEAQGLWVQIGYRF